MRLRHHAFVSLATLLLVLVSMPTTTLACSGFPCTVPLGVAPSPGLVPANLGEITVFASVGPRFAVGSSLRIWDASNPSRILFAGESARDNQTGFPLQASSFVTFGAVLEPDRDYVLEVTRRCSYQTQALTPQLFTFRTGAESAPPSTLGPLTPVRAGRAQALVGGGAGCHEYVDAAVVDLTLDPSAVPSPWSELLTTYELMVDGEPFSWMTTIGGFYGAQSTGQGFYFGKPGAFQAWAPCKSLSSSTASSVPRVLTRGKHTVWVRARVPTVEPYYIESDRREIELSCGAAAAPIEEDDEGSGGMGAADGDGCGLVDGERATAGSLQALLLALLVVIGMRRRGPRPARER